jgi:hypothetical protein
MKKISLKNIHDTLKVIDPHEIVDIRENIKEALSQEDLIQYLGNIKVITYPELSRYETIEQVFNGKSYIILLYLQSPNTGHWVTLLNYNLDGHKIIEHNDSYGLYPDSELNFNSPTLNKQLGQGIKYLTLLYNKAIKEKSYKVIYNKEKLQKLRGDKLNQTNEINNCGRYCIFRILMYRDYKMDLYKYNQFLKSLSRKYKISYDNIVSLVIN